MTRVSPGPVDSPLVDAGSILHVRGDPDRPLVLYQGAGRAAFPGEGPGRAGIAVVRAAHGLCLLAPGAGREPPAEADLTVIDTALIDRVAAATPGRRPGPVRFAGPAPASPAASAGGAAATPGRRPGPVRFAGPAPASPAAAAAQWWSARRFVTDLVGNPDMAASALVGGSAARLLVAATLAAFPHTTPADPEGGDPDVPSFATLHRALAHIDTHAHAELGVADLAAAAHVSVRAIQLAFRRHLDLTPSQYLRRARLARAHDDLRAGDPATVTVTDVARTWGFTHHSRFTALYRQTYGVTPVTTLHG